MCGITGLLDQAHSPSGDIVGMATAMALAMVHRGPDDSGVWADAEQGIALAQRRLSIIDVSPAGHQPMMSADGRYAMTYNGEIYNYTELRSELEQAGLAPAWRGRSDTEVLLAAISAFGLKGTLRRCVGMFALALWDRRERVLQLARDRLGEKPLYYGWAGETFLFGSELKALRAHPNWKADIDRGALALFMRHGYVPDPYSIYAGFSKLFPGHVLALRAGSREADIEAYWSATAVAERGSAQPLPHDTDSLVTALDAALRDAVRGQMVADVPLGAFLSGGVDSSTVVALMQAQSARPVKTFTIGFHEQGYDEARHAAVVARHLGTDHTELYVTPQQAQDVIPMLPTIYDEPFADSSQIPTYLVSRLARRHVTVTLSGDGGDELFGGYNRYLFTQQLWGRISRLPVTVRRAAASLLTTLSPSRWNTLARPFMPFVPRRFRTSVPGDKLHKLAGVLGHESSDALYHELVSQWSQPLQAVRASAEPLTALTAPSQVELADPVTRMMLLDLLTYLPGDILTKVDRAAMSVSLETRVPLLDHRVVELAWRIPQAAKIDHTGAKSLLRKVLYQYVPQELVDRPKMGFGVPIDQWLRGALRDWAEDLLSETSLRRGGYLNPEPIRQRWREHLSGQRSWHYPLWNVLMFQAWLRETHGG